MRRTWVGDEEGSAIVEFVLVAGLLVFLFMGVVQVALVLHVRNVAAASAAEGARRAASDRSTPADGVRTAEGLIRSSLSRAVADSLPCTARDELHRDSLRVSRVDCEGDVPLVITPFGRVHLHVTGRVLDEGAG